MKKQSFILVGLLIAIFTEFWRFILIAEDAPPDLVGWILIIISYTLILILALLFVNKISSPFIYYMVFAILGVIFEFFLLGTNPFVHVVVLLWVMSFWGTIVLIPRLFLTGELEKKTLIFFILALFISLGLFFIFNASQLLAFFFISLNIPYILWQFRKKKENDNI